MYSLTYLVVVHYNFSGNFPSSFFCFSDADDATEKDASVGVATHEKKTRFKRAMKEDESPTKKKKSKKVHVDVTKVYDQFLRHTRDLKPVAKDKKKGDEAT